jgi:hypothetical protein
MTDLTLQTPAQEPIYKLIVSIFWAYLVWAHLLVWPSYGDNSFTAQLCDNTLFGGLPSNWAITEEEENTCRALPAIYIAGEIAVTEPYQNIFSSPFLQSYTPVYNTCNVAHNMFHIHHVIFMRF